MIAALLLLAMQPAPAPMAQSRVPIQGVYDPANPFAQIVRGALPAAKVYEDRDVLAFMNTAPTAPGHALVIAKRSSARNLIEMDDATLGRLMAVVRRVGAAQMRALGAEGFSIWQNNGLGQGVPHLHINVIPRYPGEGVLRPGPVRTPAELEHMAARIRAALG